VRPPLHERHLIAINLRRRSDSRDNALRSASEPLTIRCRVAGLRPGRPRHKDRSDPG
jgi:hypothetical protein